MTASHEAEAQDVPPGAARQTEHVAGRAGNSSVMSRPDAMAWGETAAAARRASGGRRRADPRGIRGHPCRHARKERRTADGQTCVTPIAETVPRTESVGHSPESETRGPERRRASAMPDCASRAGDRRCVNPHLPSKRRHSTDSERRDVVKPDNSEQRPSADPVVLRASGQRHPRAHILRQAWVLAEDGVDGGETPRSDLRR